MEPDSEIPWRITNVWFAAARLGLPSHLGHPCHMTEPTDEEVAALRHREAVARLAAGVEDIVKRRGGQDLREWGGPADQTVRDILNGEWRLSNQSRATWKKLDKAGEWVPGTAMRLFEGHPAAWGMVSRYGFEGVREDFVPPPRRVEGALTLSGGIASSDPSGSIPDVPEGGTGERPMTVEERDKVVAVLAATGAALAQAAKDLTALAEELRAQR